VVTEGRSEESAASVASRKGEVLLEVAGKSVTMTGDVREAINAARTDKQEPRSDAGKDAAGSLHFVAVPSPKG